MIDSSRPAEYLDHLRSDLWRDLRAEVSRRSRGLCELCGSTGHHVHHVRYPKNLSEDRAGNLLMVCNTCHEKLHGIGVSRTSPPDFGVPDWFLMLDVEGRVAQAALWRQSATSVFGADYLEKIRVPLWVSSAGNLEELP